MISTSHEVAGSYGVGREKTRCFAVALLNLITIYDTIIVMDIRLDKPKLKISEQIAHMKKAESHLNTYQRQRRKNIF